MTTPNIKKLINNLTIKAGVMEMGEEIAWGSDTALMRQAAATLQSQAERIKELESECLNTDVRLATAIEQREQMRAAIAATEPVAKLKPCKEGWFIDLDNPPPITGETIELFTRPMPAEIEKTEPVATINDLSNSRMFTLEANGYSRKDKLFARPMPAQDVTELVEAVTCLLQLIRREAPDLSGKVMGFAAAALSKYKGAK